MQYLSFVVYRATAAIDHDLIGSPLVFVSHQPEGKEGTVAATNQLLIFPVTRLMSMLVYCVCRKML